MQLVDTVKEKYCHLVHFKIKVVFPDCSYIFWMLWYAQAGFQGFDGENIVSKR